MKVIRVITSKESVPRYFVPLMREFKDKRDSELIIVGQSVDVFSQQYPWVKFVSINIERKPSFCSDIKSLYHLTKLIKKEKPDVVHSSFPKSGLLSSLAAYVCGVRIRCHTYTGQLWNDAKWPKFSFMYWCDYLISKLNTYNMTDGDEQSHFLEKNGIRARRKKIETLGHGSFCGVDFESLSSNDRKVDTYIEAQIEGKFVFTYLARKTKDKGAIDVLDAYKEVREIKKDSILLYIGPDESMGELEKWKKNNSLKGIVEIDAVSNIYQYLDVTDVFCLPSYREGFSTILLQSAAHGVPSIGYDVPGVSEPIKKCGSGEVVPQGNIEAFSKVMIEMSEDKRRRCEYSSLGRENARAKFDSAIVTKTLLGKYQELVDASI